MRKTSGELLLLPGLTSPKSRLSAPFDPREAIGRLDGQRSWRTAFEAPGDRARRTSVSQPWSTVRVTGISTENDPSIAETRMMPA